MSIKKKILLIILTLGIILSGVGTAVMLLDFSTFTYNEEVIIGEENLKDITLSYDFDDTGISRIRILNPVSYGRVNNNTTVIMPDENMPEGEIQLELSYNPDYVSPRNLSGEITEYHEHDLNDNLHNVKELEIYTRISAVYRGELEFFMQIYRDSLNDIKNRTVSSYRLAGIEKCVIRVNPKYEKMIVY